MQGQASALHVAQCQIQNVTQMSANCEVFLSTQIGERYCLQVGSLKTTVRLIQD